MRGLTLTTADETEKAAVGKYRKLIKKQTVKAVCDQKEDMCVCVDGGGGG